MFADAFGDDALHAWVEMVARAVEDADRRLHDLRREEWEDGAVAALGFALAITASTVRPSFALPLLIGGVVLAGRALVAAFRRRDLLDQLVVERDAYAIPEVRARAEREADMGNRVWLSRCICSRLELGENPRVAANAEQLTLLAEELVDPNLDLDPACAVACSMLVLDPLWSPLNNSSLPAEDVRSRLVQIRAGFHPRSRID